MNVTDNLKGKLIAIEGGELAGKTTLLRNLKEWLEAQGLKVHHVRAPGGSPVGVRLRKLYVDDALPAKYAIGAQVTSLVAAWEWSIASKLAEGYVVLLDRSIASTFAYNVKEEADKEMFAIFALNFLPALPDLTLVLRTNESTYLSRQAKLDPNVDEIMGNDLKPYSFCKDIEDSMVEWCELISAEHSLINATNTEKEVRNEAIASLCFYGKTH